jgi:hypothetical protein
MALSDAEKNRVVELLNQLSEQGKQLPLDSLEAFTRWLKGALLQIYEKVKNALKSVWEGLRDLFR